MEHSSPPYHQEKTLSLSHTFILSCPEVRDFGEGLNYYERKTICLKGESVTWPGLLRVDLLAKMLSRKESG